jgi:hypothetical protein
MTHHRQPAAASRSTPSSGRNIKPQRTSRTPTPRRSLPPARLPPVRPWLGRLRGQRVCSREAFWLLPTITVDSHVQEQVRYSSGTHERSVTGVGDLADKDRLYGLQPTLWTIGHGLPGDGSDGCPHAAADPLVAGGASKHRSDSGRRLSPTWSHRGPTNAGESRAKRVDSSQHRCPLTRTDSQVSTDIATAPSAGFEPTQTAPETIKRSGTDSRDY